MRPVTDPSIIAALNGGAGEAATPTDRNQLLDAVRYTESRGNPNAVSPAGAVGAYQFMPDTARQFGLNPRDPNASRIAADKYLTQLEKQFGSEDLALLAYNWGPGNVQAWLKTGRGMRGQPMPLEAQQYGGQIRSNLERIQRRLGSAQPAARAEMHEVTDPELLQQLNSHVQPPQPTPQAAQQSTPQVAAKPQTVTLPEPLSWGEKAALTADKVLTNYEKALEDVGIPHLTRQQVVDFAAGALSPGGMFDSAKRIQNTANLDSGAHTVGRIVDPAAMALGGLGAGAVAKIPLLARAAASSKVIPANAAHLVKGMGAGVAAASPAAITAANNADDGAGAEAAARQLGTSAVLGGGLGVAIPALANTVGTLFTKPATRASSYLQQMFGNRTQEAIDALRNLKPLVPGERTTVGMAATPRLPQFKILEQQARNAPISSTKFAERDAINAAARTDPLEAIAQPARPVYDPATNRAMSPVESFRQRTTQPLYQRAQNTPVQLSPVAEDVLQSYRPPSGKPDTIGELQVIKSEIDLDIERLSRGTDAFSGNRLRLLMGVKKELTDAMQAASPDYAKANRIYGAISQQQNQGQVAQELLNALRSPSGIKEQQNMFLKAVQDTPRTLRRADQSARYDHLRQVMTPQQADTIDAISRSVARQAAVNDLRAGSMQPGVSPMVTVEAMTPSWFSRVATILRSASRKAGIESQSAVDKLINQATLYPQQMRKLLESAAPADRRAMVEALRNAGVAGSVNTTLAE